MEYIHLGRTGLRVSHLCLGTMAFGREAAEVKLSDDVLARLDAIWPGPGQAPEAYAW
jgi:aryl-alcohol dehydrogenase-like predicted oxidoreductase